MNIFDQVEQHFHHHDQENHMTPQQPASVVDSLHAITSEIRDNQLVARCIQYRIGALLTPAEADHVIAIIASIEQVRSQQRAPVADQPRDGGTQQPVQQ